MNESRLPEKHKRYLERGDNQNLVSNICAECTRLRDICHEHVSEMHEMQKRIFDLERNNSILADQLKKREGFWLAPDEPTDDMLVSGQEAFVCIPRGPLEDCKESHAIYKAMRDNWLSRNK